MKKQIKITLSLYTILALITSCTPNIANNLNLKEKTFENSTDVIINKYSVRGNVEFPTHPLTPSLGLTPKGRGTNYSPFEGGKGDVLQVPSIRQSWKSLNPVSEGDGYTTKATLGQVGNKATVSLIFPPDDVTSPNVTIGTGLTDASGVFTVNPTVAFTPVTNKIYILEALKRIGAAGNDVITIRTYLKWNGSSWESMTTPGIYINSKTTALSIIDSYDTGMSASDTIGTIIIDTPNPGSNPTAIGSVSSATILGVSDFVDNLLTQDVDPVRNISYSNNKYFVNTEPNHAALALNDGLNCPNCNLMNEDLSNKDFSGIDLSYADLSNANLSNTILSNANFSNANLNGANLTGTTITGAIFSGATWTNGTPCASGSVGICNPPIGEFRVNTYTKNYQFEPSVAMDSTGNFVVTWTSGGGTDDGQDGSYYGIYAQRYNSNGTKVGSEFRVNTYTTNDQQASSIAMENDGDFVVVWESVNFASDYGIGVYGKRFHSDGTVNGTEFHINSYTRDTQGGPSVAIDNSGNFIVACGIGPIASPSQYGSYSGIYAQRYNSNGAKVGSEFRVNTFTTNEQFAPSLAMDNTGNFVVTWTSGRSFVSGGICQDGSGFGIYAQKYNSNGDSNGSEFKVNTYITNNQKLPSVTMDNTGRFIIVWGSIQDEGGYGVYGQRYNSDGNTNGSEFRVNTYTTNNQAAPSVVMDNNGNFVVSWASNYQDGSGSAGVYAQRYNSDGSTNGSEFIVNTYTTGTQGSPSMGIDDSGNFVTTWVSGLSPGVGQDGDAFGIYGKRYNSSGVEQ